MQPKYQEAMDKKVNEMMALLNSKEDRLLYQKTTYTQSHLNKIDTINYGSYYTPINCVDIVYTLLSQYTNINEYKVLDTSCGCGNFLRYNNCIGADIDKIAIKKAKNNANCKIIERNGLLNVCREKYEINRNEKLIIVGNPPYNDTTSIINNKIKQEVCKIDNDFKHRDIGCSFLLSYVQLYPDYICILHPLSYLIKQTNFNSLKVFCENYRLIDGIIVSSGIFYNTSKTTHFPIIIALYKKDKQGMNFDYIKQYTFRTIDNKQFSLNNFDVIDNYITKYPNHKVINKENTITYFYTMRDINALKRSQTFMKNETANSIRVNRDNFAYYCYVDCFKDEIEHLPYYFGNCNIQINNDAFLKIKDCFIEKSCTKYSFLNTLKKEKQQNNLFVNNYNMAIDEYFKNLLGVHYVY